MKSRLNRQIYDQLNQNSLLPENRISKVDQKVIFQILKLYTFSSSLFQSKTYNINVFKVCLNQHQNLKEIISQILDEVQNLIGGYFSNIPVEEIKVHRLINLKQNLQKFLNILTDFIYNVLNDKMDPLVKIKIQSFLTNLESIITNSITNYNILKITNDIFQKCWIHSFLNQPNNYIMQDIIKIRQIDEKINNLMVHLIKQTDINFENKDHIEKLYLYLGLINNFFQSIDFNEEQQNILINMYDLCFKFIKHCLQINDIEKLPLMIMLLIKLSKQRRLQYYAFDNLIKQQTLKIIQQSFGVVIKQIDKLQISQIYKFCDHFQKLIYLGFENLEANSFHEQLRSIHSQFVNQRNYNYIDDIVNYSKNMIYDRKLLYIIKKIEQIYVNSYTYDSQWDLKKVIKKQHIDQRITSIINLVTKFQEIKLYTIQLTQQEVNDMISMLRLSSAFLKNQHVIFSPSVISEMILPKFDLSGLLSQKVIIQQHKLTKKLFKFYLTLIRNMQDNIIRGRALRDLSHSLSLLFSQQDHNQNDLESIALKLSKNFGQLPFKEKVNFLLEVIQYQINFFYEIENKYLQNREEIQKKMDIKRVLFNLPFISQISTVFLEFNQFEQSQKMWGANLMTEFWVFFVINRNIIDQILQEEKQENQENQNQFSQINLMINKIALLTPNLLEGESITFLNSKIINLIQETKKDKKIKDYVMDLKNLYSDILINNLKIKNSDSSLMNIIHFLILEQIFKRRLDIVSYELVEVIGYYKTSILENIIVYLKDTGINKKLKLENIQLMVQNTCEIYIAIFRDYKLTSLHVKEKIIINDVQYLIQASCSFDEKINQFSQRLLNQYINYFPGVVFNSRVIMVFAETLTALHYKCSIEYDSISSILIGEHLNYQISLPTDIQKVGGILIVLMSKLQQLMLRGHFIDHNFLKVLVQHIIKQEASLTSNMSFGYRFVKYESITFRGDRNMILDQIFSFNPCLWLTNPKQFTQNILKCKINQFLVDQNLYQLNQIGESLPKNYSQILEPIETSIMNEIEIEFQMDQQWQKNDQYEQQQMEQEKIDQTLEQLSLICFNLNIVQFIQTNRLKDINHIFKQPVYFYKMRKELQDIKGIHQRDIENHLKKIKAQLKKELLTNVASLRNTILKYEKVKNMILSQLLDISKKFLHPYLLKYLLSRFIPYMHSLQENYFDSTLFYLLGEMLNYIVIEMNIMGNLQVFQRVSSQDIFQLKCDYMQELLNEEIKDFTSDYIDIVQKLFQKQERDDIEILWISMKTNHIGFHQARKTSLFKMHKMLMRFLNENMQVHIAKQLRVSIIFSILNLNFKIEKTILEILPLENIAYVIKSFIEILQVQKAFVNRQDLVIKIKKTRNGRFSTIVKNMNMGQQQKEDKKGQQLLESQYFKMLKFSLNHFSKIQNVYKEKLVENQANIGKLKQNLKLFQTVCLYLQDDQLNEILQQNRKTYFKKLQRKMNLRHKTKQKQKNVIQLKVDDGGQLVEDQFFFIKITQKQTGFKKTEASLGYPNSCIYSLKYVEDQKALEKEIKPQLLRTILIFLFSQQIDNIKASQFSELSKIENKYTLQGKTLSNQLVNDILQELITNSFSPNLQYYMILSIQHCIQKPQIYYDIIAEIVTQNHKRLLHCSHLLELYINLNILDEEKMREIFYWKSPHIQLLLKFIGKDYEKFPFLQLYFTKTMKRLYSEQLIFYLPQIYLSMGTRAGPIIKQFLVEQAESSLLFSHQLLGMSKVESINNQQVADNLKILEKIAKQIITKVKLNMDPDKRAFYERVDEFYENVTCISSALKPSMLKSWKKTIIKDQIEKINQVIPQEIYLITNPKYKIIRIDADSGQPMQSAAKCPIMVSFICQKYQGPDKYFIEKIKEKKVKQQEKKDKLLNAYTPNDEEVIQNKFVQYLLNPLQIKKFPKNNQKSQVPQNEVILIDQIKLPEIQLSRQNTQKLSKQESKPVKQQWSSRFIFNSNDEKSIIIENNEKIDDNEKNEEKLTDISCIFKVFDDVRQDQLALQIIHLFKCIFIKLGLELFVFPYKTFSSRTGKTMDIGGIIECVKDNAKSRDQLGKNNECDLYNHFINKFGTEDKKNFQIARENFIKSLAPYSIISYILQIKDRHNGNIMINDKGHIIHIDFGFMFETSPAKNLKFERANFKLTPEMIKIIGGSKESEPFQFYVNQTIRAFLAVREYHNHIYNMISLMTASSLPCFLKNALTNLWSRFVLEKNDMDAALHIKGLIDHAYDNLNTKLYDDIQYLQNKIYR